jgi:hypothetical protein
MGAILKASNQHMYQDRGTTRFLSKSGQYKELIARFEPVLESWYHDFQECLSRKLSK